ncbi:xanthine dehydrogenase family protein molybdopterin-binding subunit [Streptomyces sp. NPDC003442]
MTASAPLMGATVPRREDERFLTGRGAFVADLTGPGTWHAVFVRSSYAAARIRAVETAAARRLPGVLAVLTGEDLAGRLGPLGSLHKPQPAFVKAFSFHSAEIDLPCLAIERVHYVGEPLAVVVAESRAIAEDAAELVDIAYERDEPVADARTALSATAPRVHPELPDNVAASLQAGFGDVDAARRSAAHVVRNTFRIGRHSGIPLECRGVLSRWDQARQRVEVWTSTQVPHFVRTAITTATGWPTHQVRVRTPDVGGGFGPKANVYAEEVVVAYLARLLNREVAWIEDRAEHFQATAQGRDQELEAELAVDSDGRILSWSVDYVVDVGAGSLWVAGIIANTALHLLGAYRIPHYRVSGRAVYTNKTIVAQYRGAGRPEACFALERSLDAAADAAGLPPEEIRRRNILRAEDLPHKVPLPYRDGVPITYDGADFGRCLDACLKLLPAETVTDLAADYPDLLLGHGISTYVEATGRGPYESGRARLLPGGTFEIAAGSASAGQSHETTFAQVAAQTLGVPFDAVRVRNGDTDAVTYGIGSFASRSAVVGGSAVYTACRRLRERGRELAAELLDVRPDDVDAVDGGFSSSDGRDIGWERLATELAPGGGLADHQPLDQTSTFSPPTVTWTMGAHAAVVGIDPGTGIVRVLRYAVAHEGGDEINPAVVEGQVRGGVAQGIGGTLLEEFAYSAEGQPQTTTFAEYLLPGTFEVPPTAVAHLHGPADLNPLGVKGVGESGTIAVYSTVAAAVEDAASSAAGRITTTPIRPSTVLALLTETEGEAS